MARNPPAPKTIETHSAGGVVVNKIGRILLVNQRGNSWSLPKGHLEAGEEALEAAIREIREEAGIERLTLIRELGSYSRYRIGMDGQKEDTGELKHISMFLFRTDEMKLKPLDPNHPLARWTHEDDVEGLLTHPKDKLFFRSIRKTLRR